MSQAETTLRIDIKQLPVTDMAAMLRFYQAVFGTEFTAVENLKTICYLGQVVDLPLMFCPKESMKTLPEKPDSFRFTVPVLETAIAHSQQNGGEQIGEVQTLEAGRAVVLRDPEGNLLELVEELALT